MRYTAALLLVLALAVAGCSGGSKANGGSTPGTGSPQASAAASGATAAAPERTPETLDEARAGLDRIVLKPADLPDGWTSMSDTTLDNAQAVAADPTAAASDARCGRLVGRTTTLQPANVVGSFISGEVVSYFSQVTVYATNAGAADCAAQAAQQLSQPGALAKAFGTLFVDPNAVVVTPVQYPTVADGSFAATLAGKVNANGTIIDLTLLVVAFRKGNVSAVVGSAANEAPPADALKPYVDLVAGRIGASQ